MTVPGRTAIFAVIMLAALLVGAAVDPTLGIGVLVADVCVLLLFLLEGRRLLSFQVTVEREEKKRLQINRETDFSYRIENRGKSLIILSLRQIWPDSFSAETDNFEVKVAPGEVVRAALTATPQQRGRIEMPAAEIDIRFSSGWAKRRSNLEPEYISVYPDLKSLVDYDTLRRNRALRQFGIHKLRLVGAGREFEQLREYMPDDDFRDVNWKATARRNRPVTNVYQAERSQDVLVCIDCGRMMGNPVGKGVALDYAIDASIMLSYVSNRQGDRVGLVLFKDVVNLFLKPQGGIKATNRIIEELVDAVPEGIFPSYTALVGALRKSNKRRSMIFLFTDLNDPQLAANLADVLPLVSRRHIFVVISLRDPLLDMVANGPAANNEDVYKILAARQLVSERDARSRELVKTGVKVLEADADSISLKVLNTYLSIKTRQLL